MDYPVGYFFSDDPEDEDYVLTVAAEQMQRQLAAQYPSAEVINRASIMVYFDEAQSEIINRMWIRVRCFNISHVPIWAWIALAAAIAGGVCFWLQRRAAKERLYS